jgi:fumarylacetoacetate (FAA) hydrolase
MKLASLRSNTSDGRLVVVSRDLTRAVAADHIAATMQAALDDWARVTSRLEALSHSLEDGTANETFPFDPAAALSPLPRPRQWLDASAFLNHGILMARAWNTSNVQVDSEPLMYQGLSDHTLAPTEDVPLPFEQDAIDFEGEFAVILDDTQMGVKSQNALAHVRLILFANDWSLRAQGAIEIKRGFGFLQAKPATSYSPVAVTPDELGDDWQDGRVNLPLVVHRNDAWFGAPLGGEMAFSFGELIAHAAYSRKLSAGTIVGSGTVSNTAYQRVGATCISERRCAEMIDQGKAMTPFMAFGDRVRMEVFDTQGASIFGAINQRVIQASIPTTAA